MTAITTATDFCTVTPKQCARLVALVGEREVPETDARELMALINAGWLDVPTASEWIDRFEALPKESDDV